MSSVTLEFRGALADRLAEVGRRRGTRTLVDAALDGTSSFAAFMTRLVESDDRYALLFDCATQAPPEHVEVVLNDRVLDLQGGVNALLKEGDVLTFLPAHAGGELIADS